MSNYTPTSGQKPSSLEPWWGIFALIAVVILISAFGRTVMSWVFQSPNHVPAAPRPVADAPFITTPDEVVDKMVEIAQISEDDMVYDLGCGDGRLVITAALKSGCEGVGIDYDPELVTLATENARAHGVEDRVQMIEQNVYTVDMSKADVVLTYLLLDMLEKLTPQFQEMAPGCRIVTHDFWIHGVEPDAFAEVETVEDGHGSKTHGIYLYTIPLRVNPAMERGKPPRHDYSL